MTVVISGTTGITTPELDSSGPVTANGVTTSIYPLVSGTSVSSTSGTSIAFTNIPSWVNCLTMMFSGVSVSGTSLPQVQLGDSDGYEITEYGGRSQNLTTSPGSAVTANDTGFKIQSATATNEIFGVFVFRKVSGNTWLASGQFTQSATASSWCTGNKTLSGTLDRIRITTVNGTDTFDGGSINIMYQ